MSLFVGLGLNGVFPGGLGVKKGSIRGLGNWGKVGLVLSVQTFQYWGVNVFISFFTGWG